ncbi:MAG: hypothetical protein HY735_29925 [Verrucomicrobia bacterium]|nr:hypothetical protein [Verrucomicrobiota bacterium]
MITVEQTENGVRVTIPKPGGHPQFFSPRYLFIELFKHKERLIRALNRPPTGLTHEDAPA